MSSFLYVVPSNAAFEAESRLITQDGAFSVPFVYISADSSKVVYFNFTDSRIYATLLSEFNPTRVDTGGPVVSDNLGTGLGSSIAFDGDRVFFGRGATQTSIGLYSTTLPALSLPTTTNNSPTTAPARAAALAPGLVASFAVLLQLAIHL